MAGAINKLSIDVLSPVARTSFPGAAPRDDAYAQVAKAVSQNAAGGSAVPTKNRNVDQGQMSAASQSSTTDKSGSRTGEASSVAVNASEGANEGSNTGSGEATSAKAEVLTKGASKEAAVDELLVADALGVDGDMANGKALVVEADSAETFLTDGASEEIDPELVQKQALLDNSTDLSLPVAQQLTSAPAQAAANVQAVPELAEVTVEEAESQPAEAAIQQAGSQPAEAAIQQAGSQRAEAAIQQAGSQPAEAAVKQASPESSAVNLDGSEITLTDNRGGVTLENQVDKRSLAVTAVTVTRGDATAAISGKLMLGANAATDTAADVMRQSGRMASEADTTADQRRNVSAEPSLRGSAEGKLASGDGSAMAKLLAAEIQSADSRPTTSSVSDTTPLTPLSQSPNPLAVKPAAALLELALPTRLGDPGWQEGLSGRVSMMVNQRIGVATIRMNPPELGPIEVKVNLNHDQASVQFVSHAAQVRDALEQSIPRLREMLEQSGFTLVDSQVSDQSPQQQQQEQQQAHGRSETPVGVSDLAAQITTHEAVGLIDYYA
jgi:flagellar hook-length control protein FliK